MKPGYVYFVAATGRIKIGFTAHPEHRLSSLQRHDMERLTLIATIPGTRALELEIQRRLAAYRLRHEWFRDCDPVWECISELVERAERQEQIVVPPKRRSKRRDTVAVEEAARLVRQLAGMPSATTHDRIVNAASKLGWGYRRAKAIWCGETKRIDSWEMDLLRRVARSRRAVQPRLLAPTPPLGAGWSAGLVA